MIIDRRTKYKDILPFMGLHAEEIKNKIGNGKMKKDMVYWTCGDFVRILNNDEDFIYKEIIGKSRYAIKMIGSINTFENTMKSIHNYLNQNQTKPTDEETQAANGIKFPTMQEQIFLKMQERFHLQSFKDVENMLLTDYLLICKEESAMKKFEKNLNMIFERKRKLKQKQ